MGVRNPPLEGSVSWQIGGSSELLLLCCIFLGKPRESFTSPCGRGLVNYSGVPLAQSANPKLAFESLLLGLGGVIGGS